MKNLTDNRSMTGIINQARDDSGQFRYRQWSVRGPQRKGVTEFRAFPQVVDGKVQPMYLDTAVYRENPLEYLSDAIISAESAVCWGEQLTSFLSPTATALQAAGVSSTPLRTVYWNLYQMVKNRPTETPEYVHKLFRYERSRGALIRRPEDSLFMQGALFMLGGEVPKSREGAPRPMFPAVFQINQRSARRSLLDGLVTPAEKDKPLSSRNNLIGPVLELDGATLLVQPSQASDQNGQPITAYKALAGRPYPVTEQQVVSAWVPWEDLLRFPSVSESIQLMANAIGAQAVLLALDETPYTRFIPEEVREMAARLTSPRPAWTPGLPQAPEMPPPARPVAAPPVGAPLPPLSFDVQQAPVPPQVVRAPSPAALPELAAAQVMQQAEVAYRPKQAAAPVPPPAPTGPADAADDLAIPSFEPFAADGLIPDQKALLEGFQSVLNQNKRK